MKKFTNHSPGLRGLTINSPNGPFTHYLEPGQSASFEAKDVIAVPDLGTPPSGDDGVQADLAGENADLRKQVAEQAKEIEALKAENADLKKAPEEPDADLIKAAVEGLDPKNDEHWTKAGLPEVKAVEAALGAQVTRAQIEAAVPEAKRPTE